MECNQFFLYDKTAFMSTLVMFVHRNIAYLISIFTVILSFKWFRANGVKERWITFALLGIIVVQVSMGILTLLASIGSIPVLYGSIHQGVGILFITLLFYLNLISKPNNII